MCVQLHRKLEHIKLCTPELYIDLITITIKAIHVNVTIEMRRCDADYSPTGNFRNL